MSVEKEVRMYHRTLKQFLVSVNLIPIYVFITSILTCTIAYAQLNKQSKSRDLPRLAVLDFRDEAQLASFERAALATREKRREK